jgi:serine/threonine-protein kinase
MPLVTDAGRSREQVAARGAPSELRATSRRSQPPGDAVRLPEGTVLSDKYRIDTLLGEGGMGTVFRATHLALHKEVAIKVMRPELAADRNMSARFEREALASSRISSPHVVIVHDFGRDGDLLYLVMELLHGESLIDRLEREGCLSVSEAIRITTHIARALAVAHEAGIVHRDLKPENVFLTKDGTAKVLDFGIARLLRPVTSGSKSVTTTGMIMGTPLYMSPEMAANLPVGPAADLYSLGVMLFEMLTGGPLFHEEAAVLLMGAHLRKTPPRIRDRAPSLSLPEGLEDLIGRLLAKKPETRGTIRELLAELESFRSDGQTSGEVSLAAIRASSSGDRPQLALDRSAATVLAAPPAPAPHTSARVLETPVTAPVTNDGPKRASWPLVAALLLALAIAGSIAAAVALSAAGEDPTAEPPPVEVVTPPPRDEAPAASVAIRFIVSPETARVVSADGEVEGTVLHLPADGAARSVRIEADGFVPREVSIVADRSREVPIDLEPQEAATPPTSMRARRPVDPPSMSTGAMEATTEMRAGDDLRREF